MYPSDFAYHAPSSVGEVVSLLRSSNGEAKLLAGGQSLIPLLKLRLAEPGTLIDISKVAELRGISEDADSVVLGAMTTYFQAIDSPLVQRRCPLILQTLQQVGDPQVRARGTIGGSLAHADPAGDLPATALALNAEMRTIGPNGERRIPAQSFFVDMLTTALEPDEVLRAVRFQATDGPRTGTAYVKHRHPASGYAIVGVAAVVRLAEDGSCAEARIAITGAGTHAVRADGVERALAGRALDDASVSAASSQAASGLDLMGDTYASADFRGHLAQVLTKRALLAAAQRARGQA
jgi:carbon-monoxide dehydrogenase medium subunit